MFILRAEHGTSQTPVLRTSSCCFVCHTAAPAISTAYETVSAMYGKATPSRTSRGYMEKAPTTGSQAASRETRSSPASRVRGSSGSKMDFSCTCGCDEVCVKDRHAANCALVPRQAGEGQQRQQDGCFVHLRVSQDVLLLGDVRQPGAQMPARLQQEEQVGPSVKARGRCEVAVQFSDVA